MFDRFISDQRGATSIEYALIASLISIAIIGALLAFQGSMSGMFQYISDSITSSLASNG
ncbi:MAG TPA: Flp family type IVb pilin [Pelagibacterium sp.]|uniref:Flp family type IVb pilin n=1 Tax=uncultured Pelagibacterium sp. TaxID=1159875 RepID=UPI000C4D7AB6|nr:Flp family type IVb pilin [Pelagibacterium sp.]HCO53908.1 Flp family type IVb pilin [Pelagibacterium sp.]